MHSGNQLRICQHFRKITLRLTFDFSTLYTVYIHPSSKAEGQDGHVGKSNISLQEWVSQVQISCGQ